MSKKVHSLPPEKRREIRRIIGAAIRDTFLIEITVYPISAPPLTLRGFVHKDAKGRYNVSSLETLEIIPVKMTEIVEVNNVSNTELGPSH